MPRPTETNATYLPGLDGLRAISVLLVLGYHLNVPSMGGGLVGVGMFFTLSGYLITTILLRELIDTSRVDLKRFWVRRLRRLLPALVVVLVSVLALTVVIEPEELWTRLAQSAGALLYVSNWQTILAGESYFDRFSGPGPFDHLWSLAIEEQFYVFWPLLLAGLWSLAGPVRRTRPTRLMLALTAVLIVASFAALAMLATPGFDNTRAYEGTDTRAGGMLVGALIAMLWRTGRRASGWRPSSLRVLDTAGVLSLAALAWIVASTDQYSMTLYRGGLASLALATAILVAVVAQPTSLLGRGLGWTPLRWIGERSYGIYLWHVPIIAFMPDNIGQGPWWKLAATVVPLTLVASALSWTLIEDPIRRHGFGGVRSPIVKTVRSPLVALVSLGAVVLVSIASFLLLTRTGAVDSFATAPLTTAPSTTTTAPALSPSTDTVESSTSSSSSSTTASSVITTTTSTTVAEEPTTGCTALTHVGDSTSVGLIAENVLTDPTERIDARYRAVGVDEVATDIAGAISIIETIPGEPNAEDRVAKWVDLDPDRCWVLALGTNDAANMSIGGASTGAGRIDRIMDRLDGRPALWLTVRTLRSGTPYADDEMAAWNESLVEACQRHPNMAVYDWATEVSDEWFIDDGIHFTSDGYRERAQRLAVGLATAFPDSDDGDRDGHRAGPCLVESGLSS